MPQAIEIRSGPEAPGRAGAGGRRYDFIAVFRGFESFWRGPLRASSLLRGDSGALWGSRSRLPKSVFFFVFFWAALGRLLGAIWMSFGYPFCFNFHSFFQ